MWHKLIQTFVDNPVDESSPCMIQKEETSHAETQNCNRIPGASRNDATHSGRYVYVGDPGCRLYSGGSATGGLSHMEISHSGRPLLGPLRSMSTGS